MSTLRCGEAAPMPFQSNALALVFARRPGIVVRDRPCQPGAPPHQLLHLGAAGARARGFRRPAEGDVPGSAERRDAAHVVQIDSLACGPVRGGREPNLCMVRGAAEAAERIAAMRGTRERRARIQGRSEGARGLRHMPGIGKVVLDRPGLAAIRRSLTELSNLIRR